MAKRGRGEGTIYPKGNGWVAQYYDATKKRHTISGTTRKDVQEKLHKALTDIAEGQYIDTPNVEFGIFVRDYMETYKKQEISATTFSSYCENL